MTPTELAILIAALRYFTEEFGPAGAAAIDRELPGRQVTPTDLHTLQRRLATARLVSLPPEALSTAVESSAETEGRTVLQLGPA